MLAFGPALHAADLRIALAADVTSVDPHFANIAPNNNIGWHVFDALTHVDENARLIPGLARVVARGRRDDLGIQAAPRREVPRRLGFHRRGRGVLARARREAAEPGQFAGFVQRIVAKQIVDP